MGGCSLCYFAFVTRDETSLAPVKSILQNEIVSFIVLRV